jgi:hypothetical protein
MRPIRNATKHPNLPLTRSRPIRGRLFICPSRPIPTPRYCNRHASP